MEHGKLFNLILGIFQFTGMIPISLHHRTKGSSNTNSIKVLLSFWSVTQFIALLVLIIVVFTVDGIFAPHNYIGEFNDMIKIASVFATHAIILVEAFCSRHNLSEFWQKVGQVDKNTLTQFDVVQEHKHRPQRFETRFSRKFFLHLLVVLSVEIGIISSIQEDRVWCNLWYLSLVSLTVTRLRHLNMMLHVDTISFRLKLIRMELETIVENEKQD